jgi:hypothetical protein
MNISENITVIIPVHELNKETTKMLKEAVKSVRANTVQPKNIMLVGPIKVLAKAKGSLFTAIDVQFVSNITNPDATTFADLVNLGVKHVETPYFMILEMDDILAPFAINMADLYIGDGQKMNNTAAYMPLVVEMDKDLEKALKYTNELLWVQDINTNLGYLSPEMLQQFADFNLTGTVINKAAFLEVGGLKTNIELTFNYEFLLRFTQKYAIESIPYAFYIHRNGREGSIMQKYNDYPATEIQYWFDVAKNEYLYETQRELNRGVNAESAE